MESNSSKDLCEPVDIGDPDVTGFGVLISFLFSVVLVIIAIIWAYFKDALPANCYNEFDDFLLKRKVRDEDGERVRSLRSFILSLSDQQLVSGLALVISINIIRNGVQDLDTKISAYAYSNAVYLAYFSCIIHLATIAVLCDYLRDRAFLRNVRVAIMITIIGLLIQGLTESWTSEQSITLRCATERYSFLQDWSAFDEVVTKLGNPANVFGFAILIGILITGYIRRIQQLYFHGSRNFPRRWQKTLMAKTIGWPESPNVEVTAAIERLALRLSGPAWNIHWWCQVFFVVLPGSFNRSFMFEIVWIIFYFTFGIAELSFYLRAYDNSGPAPISFEPRFGQLLPLVLIILPFLAVVEGYSDVKKSRRRETQPQSSTVSHVEQAYERDIEFISASESHHLLMKISSWVFVLSYFLICTFISLAVGQNFRTINLDSTLLVVTAAFIVSGLSIIKSLGSGIFRLWTLRAELQRSQRTSPP
ncbi:hypothetical protein F4777DRAFT_554627 [Nemania sp. FL0916]|nr:hypothetical protein F4777DRAFT_554627 [Nemania sp. FL0916]